MIRVSQVPMLSFFLKKKQQQDCGGRPTPGTGSPFRTIRVKGAIKVL